MDVQPNGTGIETLEWSGARQYKATYLLFLPIMLLWLVLSRHVKWQGSPLHLSQMALLCQLRPLEPRVTVHFHQLVDLKKRQTKFGAKAIDQSETNIHHL